MCGLVAVIHPGALEARAQVALRMLASLRHRGPDDDGVFSDAVATLGFRRLSILDLSPLGQIGRAHV